MEYRLRSGSLASELGPAGTAKIGQQLAAPVVCSSGAVIGSLRATERLMRGSSCELAAKPKPRQDVNLHPLAFYPFNRETLTAISLLTLSRNAFLSATSCLLIPSLAATPGSATAWTDSSSSSASSSIEASVALSSESAYSSSSEVEWEDWGTVRSMRE